MRIALLGAPGTGRSTLARELAQALRTKPDLVIADDPPPVQCRGFDFTLLMGVDLAGSDEAADALLRQALQDAGVAYQVIYGTGPARLRAAMAIVEPSPQAPKRWTWNCDRCGDADCEHRLFRL